MLKYYHALSKKYSFFEGWYFKHVQNNQTIAIIPGIHFDHLGHRFAFIEVIANCSAYYIPYPFSAFNAHKNCLDIQIDVNHFSSKGIKIFIDTPGLRLKGAIHYGFLKPLMTDSSFSFYMLPFIPCHHAVISMHHPITGYLIFNDELIDFNNGTGYIETDWGRMLPKTYLWTQCNVFNEEKECCIMASIFPVMLFHKSIMGCSCAIYYHGSSYILSTSAGARVVEYSSQNLVIKQGFYTLSARLLHRFPYCINTFLKGDMNRIIHECPNCEVSYTFSISQQSIFNLTSCYANFEYSF